jgi:nucleotide-binding universal stress UspA family protein
MSSDRIIVGYDGSASSYAAARWAGDEAELRHAVLRVITCYGALPEWSLPMGTVGYDVAGVERSALESASGLVGGLRDCHRHLSCDASTILGEPRDVLVRASADASMVVVGTTTSRGLVRLCMGSVASSIVRNGRCPIVVVPAGATSRTTYNRVVVGVDGSVAAAAALEWATDEASVRGAELVIIHAWTLAFDGPALERSEPLASACADARVTLNRALAAARFVAPGCRVAGRLVEGHPAAALLAATEDADLVVVGSPRRGALRTLFSTSAARVVVDGASCPTAVIPAATPCSRAIAYEQFVRSGLAP